MQTRRAPTGSARLEKSLLNELSASKGPYFPKGQRTIGVSIKRRSFPMAVHSAETRGINNVGAYVRAEAQQSAISAVSELGAEDFATLRREDKGRKERCTWELGDRRLRGNTVNRGLYSFSTREQQPTFRRASWL